MTANVRVEPTAGRMPTLAERLRLAIRGLWGVIALDRSLVAVFVASRLLVAIAALAAETLIVRNAALTSGDGGPILRSLTSWDGWFYLGIIRDGYHAAAVVGTYHDYAFLPLYPVLVRVLAAPWPAVA